MLRVALAQLNQVVGDIDGNAARLMAAIEQAEAASADLVAAPELAITGYPPEDLVLKKSFVSANRAAMEALAKATGEAVAVFGFVDSEAGLLYNAAAVCRAGRVLAVYRKQLLPNYGVFDEDRYFRPGSEHFLFDSSRGAIGVCVCEDAWSENGPLVIQGRAGAQVVVNINASPFHKGKLNQRAAMLSERARRAEASIVYVNMVGGQDELVFDGGSLVIDPDGEIVARLPQFEPASEIIDVPLGSSDAKDGSTPTHIDLTSSGGQAFEDAPRRKADPDARGQGGGDGGEPAGHGGSERPAAAASRAAAIDNVPARRRIAPALEPEAEIYSALRLSLADYVAKNGFDKVVIGLSGGIDSSLTAVIAADALGAPNVLGIAMPSEVSSAHSVEDAKALAASLGIEMLEIPIAHTFRAYLESLGHAFPPAEFGIAEENLQARVRGNFLMATSNRYGHLVVATGNKSEMACGYATLYGDMAGGFALLKDVFKTEVYALSRWRNEQSQVIPANVLTKPPSAELRPDQADSDSLPPYDVLDPILEAYIEYDAGISDIVASGHDRSTVEAVVALVDRAEYKRRQAPPGPKVTTKAFGRDRRLPITNRWRESIPDEAPERSVGGAGTE